MSFWDDMAQRGEAHENMCHVSVPDCLIKLAPIIRLNPPGDILDLGAGIGRLTKVIADNIRPHTIYGVDSSDELLSIAYAEWAFNDTAYPNVMLIHNDGVMLPELPPLAGAFSVGMFQHVDDQTMVGYIEQVATLLRPGGVFTYQFVYEGEEAPLSFIRDYDDVRQWGIIPIEHLYWDQENKWCWVTAVKQ